MHLLFDLDGTLTDPREGIVACIRFALAELDIKTDPHLNLETFIGPPLLDSFTELCGSAAMARNALALYRERFSRIGLYENRLYDGITACLDRLRGKADSIHVATSKPTIYSKRIIEHFNLSPYFGVVYGSELDGSRTDKTELIGHVLERESLPASGSVMIGDRSFDMIGAKNNGLKAIGVLWGFGTEDELTGAGADGLCQHPDELHTQIFT